MIRADVLAALRREPYVPARVHMADGRHYDLPFREASHAISDSLIVFIGMRPGTRQAERYELLNFERIDHLPVEVKRAS